MFQIVDDPLRLQDLQMAVDLTAPEEKTDRGQAAPEFARQFHHRPWASLQKRENSFAAFANGPPPHWDREEQEHATPWPRRWIRSADRLARPTEARLRSVYFLARP